MTLKLTQRFRSGVDLPLPLLGSEADDDDFIQAIRPPFGSHIRPIYILPLRLCQRCKDASFPSFAILVASLSRGFHVTCLANLMSGLQFGQDHCALRHRPIGDQPKVVFLWGVAAVGSGPLSLTAGDTRSHPTWWVIQGWWFSMLFQHR